MPAKDKSLSAIDRALDQLSYTWLSDNHPPLVEAIEVEVDRGATPRQIRSHVLRRTERRELALRCEQAARWLAEAE